MIDPERALKWREENKELIEKSNQITQELNEKLRPIFLENFRKAIEEQRRKKRRKK